MPDPNLDPTDAELEMVVDEARQKTDQGPARREAEQGIRDMEARLQFLTEQKSDLLDQLELHPTDAQLGTDLTNLNHDLLEAQNRLVEYQAQLEGRN